MCRYDHYTWQLTRRYAADVANTGKSTVVVAVKLSDCTLTTDDHIQPKPTATHRAGFDLRDILKS